MKAVLEFISVTKRYGTGHVEVDALSDTSLFVERGELVAVMGPSGSGKTTLLSLAGGLDHPTAGSVRLGGVDLASLGFADLARLRRRRIGYVFQQFNLIEGLTAAENVSLPMELDGLGGAKAAEEAERALALVGMADLAERFPDELSGGEQQRVAVARAIVGDRLLLLADEPTGALDSVSGEGVLRLLREHCDRGGAGLLVTHDARFAAWADRVIFLKDGRIVDETASRGGPETILQAPAAR